MLSLDTVLAFVATLLTAGLSLALALRKRRSVASWCFSIGMLAFALESVFGALWRQSLEPEFAADWKIRTLLIKAALPAIWLCFSLAYSRGNFREFLSKSRALLLATFILPIVVLLLFREQIVPVFPPAGPASESWWIHAHGPAKVLDCLLLLGAVLILLNLEKTFRAAVGTMRWRIKFIVLGLTIIWGARIYTLSQALLFSGDLLSLPEFKAGSLIIGCVLIAVGYFRSGLSEIDIYPSHAVLQTSATVLLVGAYLFVVGVLAQIVAHTGQAGSFQLQALLVLFAVSVLALLLLSERVRRNISHFVSHHFKRPQHDIRQIWTRFTACTSSVLDQPKFCAATANLISETFNVLSVTIWLADEQEENLLFAASTSRSEHETIDDAMLDHSMLPFRLADLDRQVQPFDLERAKGAWAERLRQVSTRQFRTGGNRVCIPLRAGETWLGLVILADRVSGVPYTIEEFDLLKCIGDQVAVSLFNLRLGAAILQAKEMEAFQTVSTFFVHDLKNVASSLGLMLQTLPIHFDNPEYREDALRSIRETNGRIQQIIERLGALRHAVTTERRRINLNDVVRESIVAVGNLPDASIESELDEIPPIQADPGQLRSVITNLLINAREAVNGHGNIRVRSRSESGWASLTVQDNGVGMTEKFVRESLFRPFRTTKEKGMGIGLYQCRMIVEGHGGKISVSSAVGDGTTFRVSLPLEGKDE
jgi:putative PEP-CTERM system histidine kinase